MSTFYLLPSRPQLGDRVADFLHLVFPGLDLDTFERENLAELITITAEAHGDVYVVFHDELPAGAPLASALIDGFGAEVGDEVVDVHPFGSQRWRVDAREAA